MFREWVLFLYSVNYLLAPAITYFLEGDKIRYGMKIPANYYFSLAFPGILMFTLGIYSIRTKLFSPSVSKVKLSSVVNEYFLMRVTIVCVIVNLISKLVPGEIAFLLYLLSLVRFVGAFALFSLNPKKYWWVVFCILLFEMATGFLKGMYHDAVMWVIFFALYIAYTFKPNVNVKMIGLLGLVFFILFVQSIKGIYRNEVWSGEKDANFETVAEIGMRINENGELSDETNLLSTLNRANQAWILASTIENMDRHGDFQGLTIVSKYFEAAILPRILSPDKIKSGSRDIFNKFSGHTINEGTSMGLGIFADGYVAFGSWGVYVFGFGFGLLFSLSFKLIERWTRISAFYVLFLFPLLNYAVRPDCELQTVVNHIVKGFLLYGFLVYLTQKRFTLGSSDNNRKFVQLKQITQFPDSTSTKF